MSTVPFPLALTPPPRKSSGYISPFSSRAPFPYIIGRRRPLAPASCVLPCFETFLSREPLSSLAAACSPPPSETMGLLSAYQRAVGKSGRGGVGAKLPASKFRPKNPLPCCVETCLKHARSFRSSSLKSKRRGRKRKRTATTVLLT